MTTGSFVDSGRVTAAAEEECRESSSDMRPAERKTRVGAELTCCP